MRIRVEIEGLTESDETLRNVLAALASTPAEKHSKSTTPKNPDREGTEEEAANATRRRRSSKPASKEPAVDFEVVRAAAVKLVNAGKRDEVEAAFEAHGSKILKDIPVEELPAVLEALEALS